MWRGVIVMIRTIVNWPKIRATIAARAVGRWSRTRTDAALAAFGWWIADESAIHQPNAASAASVRVLLQRPTALAAIVALIFGQFTMVLIMTMTPLHMTSHGHGLAAVGFVLSAHTFGMYALAPVSGRLTERFGSVATIFGGTAVLITAGLLA